MTDSKDNAWSCTHGTSNAVYCPILGAVICKVCKMMTYENSKPVGYTHYPPYWIDKCKGDDNEPQRHKHTDV